MHHIITDDGKITFNPIGWSGPGCGEEPAFIGAYLIMEGHKFKFHLFEFDNNRLAILQKQIAAMGVWVLAKEQQKFELLSEEEKIKYEKSKFTLDVWASCFDINKPDQGDFMKIPLAKLSAYKLCALYTTAAVGKAYDARHVYVAVSCETIKHIFCSHTTVTNLRTFKWISSRQRSVNGRLRCKIAASCQMFIDPEQQEAVPETRNTMQIDLGVGSQRVSDLFCL